MVVSTINQQLFLRYDISYRGETIEHGGRPTWRIELLDEKDEGTDIWSDCWELPNGTWRCSREGAIYDNLIAAIQHGLRGLLEYSGLDGEEY